MSRQVDHEEKRHRMQRMLRVAREARARFEEAHVDSVAEVLWEYHRDGSWYGLTDNYLRVMSDSADVIYKCTDLYAPEHERTLRWDDPDVGVHVLGTQWPSYDEPALEQLRRDPRMLTILEPLIGSNIAAATLPAGPRLRAFSVDDIVTQEYIPQRTNIVYRPDGTIIRVECG